MSNDHLHESLTSGTSPNPAINQYNPSIGNINNLYSCVYSYSHEQGGEHSVSNVNTRITVSQTAANMYTYVIVVTISRATAQDSGAYFVNMRSGMQLWAELMLEGAESGYPEVPALHLQKMVMGSKIGVFCSAEGHAMSDISLSFNGAVLRSSDFATVTTGSRTADARAILYETTPTGAYSAHSGTYECVATSADGTQTRQHANYTFAQPSARHRAASNNRV